MAEDEDSLSVMVELALSNAKGVRRDAGNVVRDLARIRDHLNEQTEEVTSSEHDSRDT